MRMRQGPRTGGTAEAREGAGGVDAGNAGSEQRCASAREGVAVRGRVREGAARTFLEIGSEPNTTAAPTHWMGLS